MLLTGPGALGWVRKCAPGFAQKRIESYASTEAAKDAGQKLSIPLREAQKPV